MRLLTFWPGWVSWGKASSKAGDVGEKCDVTSNLTVLSLVIVTCRVGFVSRAFFFFFKCKNIMQISRFLSETVGPIYERIYKVL